MKPRWFGVSLLVFDLLLMIPRKYLPDTTFVDVVALLIMVLALIIIKEDCRNDEIRYTSKIKRMWGESDGAE